MSQPSRFNTKGTYEVYHQCDQTLLQKQSYHEQYILAIDNIRLPHGIAQLSTSHKVYKNIDVLRPRTPSRRIKTNI